MIDPLQADYAVMSVVFFRNVPRFGDVIAGIVMLEAAVNQ